ncbi:MAG: NAD-dependent epimerase/dehydratase family protein [Candidatus Aenigmarchaeota archaeon]|nr:NAD-dependent epimerase/dehydratase family protein [Candidatus Aenigmarchaeota archaeon]
MLDSLMLKKKPEEQQKKSGKEDIPSVRQKVLVTGGAGFIGSNLVKRLVADGYEVVVLDNLSTGVYQRLPKQAKFVKGDIEDDDTYRVIEGCTHVFHLAAKTDARENDDSVYRVNYLGSKKVFEAAKAVGAKVIFTSSAAVYGSAPVPHKETAECAPITQYGKSKLKAEKLLNTESSLVVRLFNVYGPEGNSVINKYCKLIPNYKDIIVYGTGMQTRDYVYVDDVINALMLGMELNGVYNIGTGLETKVVNAIDMISNVTMAKPTVKFDKPKQEIQRSKADITKIRNYWHPVVDLQKGIELTLRSYGWKPLPV